MANKAEKQRRRAIVQQLRATEFEQASASKPIADELLIALIDHLEATLFTRRDGKIASCCDHTRNHSRAFLFDKGISNEDEACAWLGEYGGFCDCEVAYNVADYWYDRLREGRSS